MTTTPTGAVGIDDANPFGPCWADTLSRIDHRTAVACMAPAVDDLGLCAEHRETMRSVGLALLAAGA